MMPNNMAPMSPEKPGSPYYPFSKRPGMDDAMRGRLKNKRIKSNLFLQLQLPLANLLMSSQNFNVAR